MPVPLPLARSSSMSPAHDPHHRAPADDPRLAPRRTTAADHATSELHAFDLDGTHLRSLDTGLPEGTLSGIEVGPDGRLWFVEMGEGAVYRVDPA